jgi:chemotaxis protein CheD
MNGVFASGAARALETPRRLTVGIGEMALSNDPGDVIVAHALGSCVAVCVFDPVVLVAGMLHFLLPESRINLARARVQPAVFADTGIPLLFQAAYKFGLDKRRAVVKLVGGAEVAHTASTAFNTGRRNALAAKNLLWRNGILVSGEECGGTIARTLHFSVADGRLRISSGRVFNEL